MNEHRFFLTAVFLAVFYCILKLYEPFLMIITIASLLAMAMYSINFKLYTLLRNKHLAAVISTLLLSTLLFGPLVYTITSISGIVNGVDAARFDKIQLYLKDIHYSYKLPQALAFLQADLDNFVYTRGSRYFKSSSSNPKSFTPNSFKPNCALSLLMLSSSSTSA